MEYIVVEGCTLEVTAGLVTLTEGTDYTLSISSSVSETVKAGGLGVYRGELKFSLTNVTIPDTVISNWIKESGKSVQDGSIETTCEKVTADKKLCFLEGDSCNVTISGEVQTGSSTTTTSVTVSVSVKKAGQNVVKGA